MERRNKIMEMHRFKVSASVGKDGKRSRTTVSFKTKQAAKIYANEVNKNYPKANARVVEYAGR